MAKAGVSLETKKWSYSLQLHPQTKLLPHSKHDPHVMPKQDAIHSGFGRPSHHNILVFFLDFDQALSNEQS